MSEHHWAIKIYNTVDTPHPALNNLAAESFEMKSICPPPRVGERLVFRPSFDCQWKGTILVEVTAFAGSLTPVRPNNVIGATHSGGRWLYELVGKIVEVKEA